MAVLGIGIIGTGSIVNTYVKCIAALEDAKLVAIYTANTHRVQEAEVLFGVPVFDDLETFLSLSEIELVCICNKSGLHGSAAIRAARAGKHVLSEKPLEVTTQKVDEVIEVCQNNQVTLGCVLQNRCNAAYLTVENAVKAKLLGKLLLGNAHINWYRSEEYYGNNPWRGTKEFDGGASFMNQGIHTIDLLLNLMGEVASVFGTMKTLVHNIECEDVGTGVLDFKNGAIGTLTAGTALYPGYPERLEIFGEKGSILMEGGRIKEWHIEGTPAPENLGLPKDASGAANPTNIGHVNHMMVLEDMIKAIREGRSPMVTGQEARKAVEVITALYRSSEAQKLIFL